MSVRQEAARGLRQCTRNEGFAGVARIYARLLVPGRQGAEHKNCHMHTAAAALRRSAALGASWASKLTSFAIPSDVCAGEAPDTQPRKRRPAGPRRRSGTSKLLQKVNSATFSFTPDLGHPRAISALSHPIAIGLSQAAPARPRCLAPALIAISAGRPIGAALGVCLLRWCEPLLGALLCVLAAMHPHSRQARRGLPAALIVLIRGWPAA